MEKAIDTMCLTLVLQPKQFKYWQSLYQIYYERTSYYFLHQIFHIQESSSNQKLWFLSQKRIFQLSE